MSGMEDDSGEEDVIEVRAANALVPNLTISVDKDDENDAEGPVVEFCDETQTDDQKLAEDEDGDSVKFNVEAKSFPHTKIYENKTLIDMGLTPEEARLRKESRAKRFRSPLLRDKVEANEPVPKVDINKIVAKVEEFNETADADAEIRLNAIHLRGLDDMSTEEIFSFFSDSFPSHIEWIDDTSCNVVWKDETSAPTAVLTMTRSNRRPKVEKVTNEEGQEENGKKQETKAQDDDDDLDLLDSDEEKMEVEEAAPAKKDDKVPDPIETENFTNELRRCKKYFTKDGRKVLLKLRLATMSDKKALGGAKKSNYYRKYGNPNYGNMRGVLSRSFMRRFHGRVAKREYQSYQPSSGNADEEDHSKDVEQRHDNAKKVASKRMYSDPQWTKAKKLKRNKSKESGSSSDGSSDDEKPIKDEEKEDLELINSSAKDLSDAIPAQHASDDEEELEEDTMMADRIAKKIAEARRSQDGFNYRSKPSGNSVWARLGRKAEREAQGIKVTLGKQQPKCGKDDVRNKLPASLRDRLGTKK